MINTCNNLCEFLRKEELTLEVLEKILNECSRFNSALLGFIRARGWKELPANAVRAFLKAYQDSQVNMKTGEIMYPVSEMFRIPIIILNNITVGASVLTFADVEYDIVVEEKDIDDETIAFASYEDLYRPGIEFSRISDSVFSPYSETLEIDLNHIDPYTKRMIISFNVKSSRENPIKELIIHLEANNETMMSLNLTQQINEHKNLIVFELIWDINEWRIVAHKQGKPNS